MCFMPRCVCNSGRTPVYLSCKLAMPQPPRAVTIIVHVYYIHVTFHHFYFWPLPYILSTNPDDWLIFSHLSHGFFLFAHFNGLLIAMFMFEKLYLFIFPLYIIWAFSLLDLAIVIYCTLTGIFDEYIFLVYRHYFFFKSWDFSCLNLYSV